MAKSKEEMNRGLTELGAYLDEMMGKIQESGVVGERAIKALDHKKNKRETDPGSWDDASQAMWKWIGDGLISGKGDMPTYSFKEFKEDVTKLTSREPEDTSGRINRATLAFNIMFNHYEGYFGQVPRKPGVSPAAKALMYDIPNLFRAFQLWIYG